MAIKREVSDRKGEANFLANAAILYSEVGQNMRAIEYDRQALDIDREIEEGMALKLSNLGERYLYLGRPDDALRSLPTPFQSHAASVTASSRQERI